MLLSAKGGKTAGNDTGGKAAKRRFTGYMRPPPYLLSHSWERPNQCSQKTEKPEQTRNQQHYTKALRGSLIPDLYRGARNAVAIELRRKAVGNGRGVPFYGWKERLGERHS